MDNQKGKRVSPDVKDTKNLSELLEFDFDSMTDASAAQDENAAKKEEHLDSFFVEDMGLPPLPESEAAQNPNLTMSSAFSKAQEKQPKQERVQPADGFRTQKVQAASVEAQSGVQADQPAEKKNAWEIVKGVLIWSKEIIVALILVWLLLTFVAQNSTVYGTSMSPTLQNGEMIIMNKFIYRFTEPARGDVIVFKYNDPAKGEELLIKRVIGLPGDSVEIIDGAVYINGTKFDESKYLQTATEIQGDISYPFVVPENSYFVMGDNRANSKDSRYSTVGAVPKSQIVGKASFRIWPLDKIGLVQ